MNMISTVPLILLVLKCFSVDGSSLYSAPSEQAMSLLLDDLTFHPTIRPLQYYRQLLAEGADPNYTDAMTDQTPAHRFVFPWKLYSCSTKQVLP